MTTLPPHLRPLTTAKLVAISKAIVLKPPNTSFVPPTYISPGPAMPGTGGPVLPDPTEITPSAPPLQCGEINTDYEISIGIVCGMCFIFGIIFNIFGYRCFKAVMFLTGFILASVVIFLICEEESDLKTGANAGIALGIGLLCGLITMLVHFFGLFMTGFCMGLFITIATLVILAQFYTVTIIWVPISIAFGCGAVGGLLTLKWQKELVIVSTSIIGGATIVVSADYFVELFRLVEYVYGRFRLIEPEPLCWYSWVILAVWPLIAVIGMLLQFRVTSKGYDHKDKYVVKRPPKTKKRVELQKIRQRETRAERLAKYQDLYKVRRCNGDVVSASYLQSIQDHLSPELQRIASITHIPPEPDIPAIPAHQNEQTTTLLDDYIDEPQSPQTQLPTMHTTSTLTSLDMQQQQYTKIPDTSYQIITDV